MILKRICPALLVLAAVAAGAQAPAPTGKAEPVPTPKPAVDFKTVDSNSDGKVTQEESQPVADLGSMFAALDEDGDKQLTPAEFAKWDRAGKSEAAPPKDPATVPRGSAGAQHIRKP